MATRSLGTLTLDLVAKIGGFVGPMDKAARNTKKNSRDITKGLNDIKRASFALGAAVSAGFAVMVKSSINAADELSKTSQAAGTTVEYLSGLKYGAKLAGVEFEALTSSLSRFNKSIFEAFTDGVGPAAEALQDLQITLRDSKGDLKSNQVLIEEIADSFSRLENGAIKTGLAQDLFGKSGSKLIPLLNGGAKGMRDAADEAERLGLIISTDTAKASEEFNDNLTRLQSSLTGVANAAAKEAIGPLNDLTKTLQDPDTQKGIANLGAGFISFAGSVANALAQVSNFTTFISEELAAKVGGINDDDLVRLEDHLRELKKLSENKYSFENLGGNFGFTRTLYGFAKSAFRDDEALESEIRDLEKKIENGYKVLGETVSREQKKLRESALKSASDAVGSFVDSSDLFGFAQISSKQIEEARKAREETEKQIKLQEIVGNEYKKITDQLNKEIALWGNKASAIELAYDLEHGYLTGLSQLRKEELLSLYKQRDALQSVSDSLDSMIDGSGLFAGKAPADAKLVENAYTKAGERIDGVFASAWQNIDGGFESLRDGIVGGFKQMLGEMAHEALTKPIVLQIQQSLSGSVAGVGGGAAGAGNAAGIIGAGGIYGAAALAVVAAVDIWNKQQDEKFEKMRAEYRQGTQSLGTILGQANQKSKSIENLTDALSKTAKDTLGVNYEMYKTLVDIRTGITGVASGFAKTLTGQNNLNIKTGTSTFNYGAGNLFGGKENDTFIGFFDPSGIFGDDFADMISGFFGGIAEKINKAIYSNKKKIIDSGIGFVGQTLADILETGIVDAFAYADVQTKKKVLGLTTSNRVSTKKETLDDILLGQFADVFSGSSKALDQAADIFGLDFNNYIDKLTLPAQSLSLKDLEGDALTKEIESFFSSTLDNWAGVLVDGTMVLEQFQRIGEGAFETVIRLAGETATFADYAQRLNLNFDALGMSAVNAVQDIAELSGGFDALAGSLSTYSDKFFSDSEKFAQIQAAITGAFTQLGEAVPATRAEFRALVEGLNLTTEAGRSQFAALMELTGATDSYLSALEREQDAREDALRDAVGGSFDVFSRAIDAQRSALERATEQTVSALQGDIEIASEALLANKTVAETLSSTLRGLRMESLRSDVINRRSAQAQLVTANAIARAGGPLPGVGQLDDALRVLAEPSENLFSTFEEYARDFYVTARNIKELQEVTGSAVSIDEQNLKTLQDQLQQAQDFHDAELDRFDGLLDYYKDQVDVLNGIDTSVISVADAVDRLTKALINAGASGLEGAPALPALPAEYETRKATQTMAITNSKAGDGSAAPGGIGLSDRQESEVVALLQKLVDGLEQSQFAIAKNTQKTSKVLERWDIDGIPEERTV